MIDLGAITAYRAKNSCETTLIRLTETWRAELDSKKVDMSKAIDSPSPELLRNKLQAYKFSDHISVEEYRFCNK